MPASLPEKVTSPLLWAKVTSAASLQGRASNPKSMPAVTTLPVSGSSHRSGTRAGIPGTESGEPQRFPVLITSWNDWSSSKER